MWSLWERSLKKMFYENTGNSMIFCAYIQAVCFRSMTHNHFELQATRKGTQEKECVSTTTQVCRNVFWMTDWSVWCGWCGCAVTVLCDRSSVGGLVPCSWVVSPAVLRFPDSPGSVLTAGRLTVTSPLCWVSLWACLLLLKSLCPVL